ncbi:Uncharacterised protein [uncultured archaeon]|nr:Uncharacterised protein [uncultured archaeon]
MNDQIANYDSRHETKKHIARVEELLIAAAEELVRRTEGHDSSKLEDPEKSYFDRLTPLLAGVTYGSPEYKGFLEEMKPALQHHYGNNSHHPEHFENGVDGMDLFDLFEMFFDWKAASERHNNGSISKSIDYNAGRFNLSPQMVSIMKNTVKNMGWDK